MHHLDPLWLLLAGFGGGLVGSVAGLASLVSYPALLALGIPPVAANVTNTVALVFSGVGSVSASRRELTGQGQRIRQLAGLAVLGGLSGGVILLATPSHAFARVAPVLIGASSLALLVPRSSPIEGPPTRARGVLLALGVFLVTLYAGYFGAAAGVVLLALLLQSTTETVPRATALKNLLLALANSVAAVAFALEGPVRWTAVAPLALGFLAGGRLGPLVVRKAPGGVLRAAIALAGVGVAIHLGLDVYR